MSYWYGCLVMSRCRLHKIYIDEVVKPKKQNADQEPGASGGARRSWRAFEMERTGRIRELLQEQDTNLSAAQRQRDTQTSRLEALKKRNLHS
jgi:hypothetical protein